MKAINRMQETQSPLERQRKRKKETKKYMQTIRDKVPTDANLERLSVEIGSWPQPLLPGG